MQPPPNYSAYPRPNQSGTPGGGYRGPGVYCEMIGEAFSLVFRNAKIYLGGGAIAVGVFIVAYIAGVVCMFVAFPPSKSSRNMDTLPIGPLIAMYGLIFLGMFVMRILMIGISVCAVEEADTGATSFRTFFSPLRKIAPLFVILFLTQLLISIGTLACFAPGIYLMGVFAFAPELCVIENLGPIEAITRSYEMIKPFAWMMGLLYLVLNIIAGVGWMVCLIGLAITMPVQFIVLGLH